MAPCCCDLGVAERVLLEVHLGGRAIPRYIRHSSNCVENISFASCQGRPYILGSKVAHEDTNTGLVLGCESNRILLGTTGILGIRCSCCLGLSDPEEALGLVAQDV